jgi:prophage antirepressor-like protein
MKKPAQIRRIFEEKEIRIELDESGRLWYHGGDVCNILGYQNPSKAIADHCDDDGITKRYSIDSVGRRQKTPFIDQQNIIRLVMRSNKSEAKRFEKWAINVIHEILTKGYFDIRNQEWQKLRGETAEQFKLMNTVLVTKRSEVGKPDTKGFHHSNEADMLNRIVFGKTAGQWREENPIEAAQGQNQRDYGTPNQQKLLAHLEYENAKLIDAGLIDMRDRKPLLEEAAKNFIRINTKYVLAKPNKKPRLT